MKDEERNYLEQWLEKAEHDLVAARFRNKRIGHKRNKIRKVN